MVEVKEELKGDVFWDLPALVTYKANTEIPVTISVVNLSDATREYTLLARTFDINGHQVSEGTILVGGLAWFEVESGDREDVAGSMLFEESNVTLGLYLIERKTNEVVDVVWTYLRD